MFVLKSHTLFGFQSYPYRQLWLVKTSSPSGRNDAHAWNCVFAYISCENLPLIMQRVCMREECFWVEDRCALPCWRPAVPRPLVEECAALRLMQCIWKQLALALCCTVSTESGEQQSKAALLPVVHWGEKTEGGEKEEGWGKVFEDDVIVPHIWEVKSWILGKIRSSVNMMNNSWVLLGESFLFTVESNCSNPGFLCFILEELESWKCSLPFFNFFL